jgi:hypothetical protein
VLQVSAGIDNKWYFLHHRPGPCNFKGWRIVGFLGRVACVVLSVLWNDIVIATFESCRMRLLVYLARSCPRGCIDSVCTCVHLDRPLMCREKAKTIVNDS